jgi:hypothetical protein
MLISTTDFLNLRVGDGGSSKDGDGYRISELSDILRYLATARRMMRSRSNPLIYLDTVFISSSAFRFY